MRLALAVQRLVTILAALVSSGALGQAQSPPVADTTLDLRTTAGAAVCNATWRFAEAHIADAEFNLAGSDNKPSGPAARTHDIHPRSGTPEFEAAPWEPIKPEDLEARRTAGKLAFAWYRLGLTLPGAVNGFPVAGTDVVLDVTVDDYAEVWVDGGLPQVLGQSGGGLIKGWNAPNRVLIARNARPGQRIEVAIFAANGPLSAPPSNYVWIRSATLDFYKPGRAVLNGGVAVETTITRLAPGLDGIVVPGTKAERVATGFAFTEGPVWVPALAGGATYGGGGSGGYLLFSDPNQNVIHRYDPRSGEVSIFRSHSGYYGAASLDAAPIGAYHQPGSNGLTLDAQGRLTICEHGNRRVTRLEPNGSITVLADRYEGKRLNSPNDLVYRSDGALYFTDPPFGLPKAFDDPKKELAFSGLFMVRDGRVVLAARDLAAPNGLAFSPDEKHLYVDNWEERRKVVLRYDVGADGMLSNPTLFYDMTSTPGEIALDGMKVDGAGNVYACGPGGVWIIASTGEHLGTIGLPEQPANICLDAMGGFLWIAARTSIYRIGLAAPGAPGSKP